MTFEIAYFFASFVCGGKCSLIINVEFLNLFTVKLAQIFTKIGQSNQRDINFCIKLTTFFFFAQMTLTETREQPLGGTYGRRRTNTGGIQRLMVDRDVAKGRAEGAPAPPLGFPGGPRMEGPRGPKSRRRRTKFTGIPKITSG